MLPDRTIGPAPGPLAELPERCPAHDIGQRNAQLVDESLTGNRLVPRRGERLRRAWATCKRVGAPEVRVKVRGVANEGLGMLPNPPSEQRPELGLGLNALRTRAPPRDNGPGLQ